MHLKKHWFSEEPPKKKVSGGEKDISPTKYMESIRRTICFLVCLQNSQLLLLKRHSPLASASLRSCF